MSWLAGRVHGSQSAYYTGQAESRGKRGWSRGWRPAGVSGAGAEAGGTPAHKQSQQMNSPAHATPAPPAGNLHPLVPHNLLQDVARLVLLGALICGGWGARSALQVGPTGAGMDPRRQTCHGINTGGWAQQASAAAGQWWQQLQGAPCSGTLKSTGPQFCASIPWGGRRRIVTSCMDAGRQGGRVCACRSIPGCTGCTTSRRRGPAAGQGRRALHRQQWRRQQRRRPLQQAAQLWGAHRTRGRPNPDLASFSSAEGSASQQLASLVSAAAAATTMRVLPLRWATADGRLFCSAAAACRELASSALPQTIAADMSAEVLTHCNKPHE